MPFNFLFPFHTIDFEIWYLKKFKFGMKYQCLVWQNKWGERWSDVLLVIVSIIISVLFAIPPSDFFFFNFFIYLFLSLSLGLVICLFLPPACSLSISPAPVFFIQNKQNKNAHSPYQQSTQIAQGLTLLSRAAAPTTGPAQLQRRSWNESIAEKQKTRVSFKCCVWQILRLLFFTRLLTHQNACPKRPIVFSFFSPLKHWTLWTGTRSIIEFLIFFFFLLTDDGVFLSSVFPRRQSFPVCPL